MVLEKDSLDIWVNGCKVEMAGEFTDDGTETHFNIGSQPAYVKVKIFFIHLHSRIIEQSCNEDSSKIYVEGSVTDLL